MANAYAGIRMHTPKKGFTACIKTPACDNDPKSQALVQSARLSLVSVKPCGPYTLARLGAIGTDQTQENKGEK